MSVPILLLMAALFLCALMGLAKLAVLRRRCKRTPKSGERWEFVDKRGLWLNKEHRQVVIRDVGERWVRYDMSLFKDQRMELDLFVRMYRPVLAPSELLGLWPKLGRRCRTTDK